MEVAAILPVIAAKERSSGSVEEILGAAGGRREGEEESAIGEGEGHSQNRPC